MSFQPESFLPYLEKVVWQLVSLTAEADTIEAKRRVTESLNVVIQQMGIMVRSGREG